MSVGTFDPSSQGGTRKLNDDELAQLLRAAAELDAEAFGLDEVAVARLACLATTDGADWAEISKLLDARDIELLIRLYTLAELRLPTWEAGAKSPVVPLARELKQRDAYPKELTSWIKSNSRNRFLPYGSLMDRL